MMKLGDILLEIKQDYKIYCDLDGVLVDFVKGYKKLTGKRPPKAETQKDKRVFWEEVDKAGSNFWADLEWKSDGRVLWNYIKKFNPEILSSPSSSKTSREGKKDWMDKYLPDVKLNLEQSRSKQRYAKPNRILIDDRADICQKWENAGGIAIHHTTANRTIKELQKIMAKKPINEAKFNIENEIFSAYNGRYLFDVTEAYKLISNKKVKSIEKEFDTVLLNQFSHPEFSAASPEKVAAMKIDYSKPIGVLVKFQDPESQKTEWILIDGNHRVRKAVQDKQPAKLYVVTDPKDVEKFLKVDPSKPHKLFPDDDE